MEKMRDDLEKRDRLDGLQVEDFRLQDLRPHPRNYSVHPEEQLEHLMQRVREYGIYRNVVIAQDNTILAGHGLIQALKKMGRETVPGVRIPMDSEDPAALRLLTGDNEVSQLSEKDNQLLSGLLTEIKSFDLNGLLGTGFNETSLALLSVDPIDEPEEEEEDPYTQKIETPLYEPDQEKPDLTDLVDTSKTDLLTDKIQRADIPSELKVFLGAAAQRHTVFDYRNIANYYAHSDEKVQALMEESALIIIDFKQAIENGFVQLVSDIAAQYSEDYNDDDE